MNGQPVPDVSPGGMSFDAFGLPQLGYSGSFPTSYNYIQSPDAQLGAISAQVGPYFNMLGQTGAAYNTALGGVQQQGIESAADQRIAQIASDQAQAVANINAGVSNLASQRGVEASNYSADKTLAGIGKQTAAQKYGYDINKDIAGIQKEGLLGQTWLQNIPKLQMISPYLGQILGSLGLGGDGASASGAPPVPAFHGMDPVMQQQQMSKLASGVNQNIATRRAQLLRQAGQGGFTADPYNEQQQQLNREQLGQLASIGTQVPYQAMQFNAQNQLPYAQAALGQYNTQQGQQIQRQNMGLGFLGNFV